jgi:hypothetical protein
MKRSEILDYGSSGFTLAQAFLDQAKRFSKNKRPDHVLWNGKHIKTADVWVIPRSFVIRGFFISKPDKNQGFDIDVDDGGLILQDGEELQTLRTWYDPKYESKIKYQGSSLAERLWIWNVYRTSAKIEEKWSGNAGFWVEKATELDRTYHCSPGTEDRPDFESLVFRIVVSSVTAQEPVRKKSKG